MDDAFDLLIDNWTFIQRVAEIMRAGADPLDDALMHLIAQPCARR